MSLAGKFTDLLSDGLGSQPLGNIQVGSVSTHAPSDAIIVPDAHLLFTGDFKRSGVDLVLSAGDRELVLHDYFKGEKRAALASPDGAHLTGDIVNALSGHTQFAQADGSASVAPAIIGSVTKLTGNATAIRNGVSIVLNQGDNVHKGDVVQSGSDSTLGITFIDGTVFGLASNAKMVLNEMIYDPNGSDNKSLLSLVAGTISFVAGATAKKGDMKVDTPVATMGIRGTAVLVEIDFEVPSQGGAPPAKFQVLVEPDGTTGSYILFDKTTLTPIATVNRAGTQTIINGQGGVSFQSSVQLSPDAQKIITDVFSLKFSDLNNPNTKLTTNFTDSIVPETLFVKLASNEFIPVTLQLLNIPTGPAPTPDPGPTDKSAHIPGPPSAKAFGGAFAERTDLTGSAVVDSASGLVNYVDINAGDIPSVSVKFSSFAYQDAQQADVSATLTAEQLAAIQAVEVPVVVVQDPNAKNYGSATWTYTVADGAFDFLAAGETLTLTYMARVDNNFAPNNESTFTPFTITITGTNDKPTIATSGGSVVELTGSGNTEFDTVSGTVVFTDADLTDRPIVSAALSSTQPFIYLDADGNDITATLTPQQLAAIAAVKVPLSVVQASGNTHNGTATWTYSVPDSAFDFIADDETLILNYVVQVDDGHGGVISTPVTVSINGADVSVTGTNDVPIIVDDSTTATDSVTEDEAATLVAGGTITFQDLDLTDTHTATFVLKSSNANANLPGYSEAAPLSEIGIFSLTAVSESPGVTNVGSIGWSFALNNNDPVLQSLAVGQAITQVYTVTFDDDHGGTVTQDVTVTITGTNDAPTITSNAAAASAAVIEDASTPTLSTGGTIAIQDLDLIDTHTAIWEFKSSASNEHLPGFDEGSTHIGTFTIDPSVTESISDTDNGATLGWSFTLDDNDAVLQSLALGQTITQIYTVTFDDDHGGTVTQDVTITITGTNDAPTVTSNAAAASGAVIEDASTPTLSTGGTIAIQDLDLIDTHTAIWEFKSSASNEHLPGFDEGSTHIGTFTIDPSVTESISDTDNGATLGWSFTLDDNDAVLQSLALGQTITQIYTVTFTDNNGASIPQDVTVTITGINDAPEIGAIAATLLDEKTDTSDLTATIGVTFTDVDLTNIGHTATITDVTVDGDTAGLVGLSNVDLIALVKAGIPTKDADSSAGSVDLDFSAASTAFDYLAEDQSVTLTYTVEISDGDGGTTSQDFTITIDGTNDAPVLTASTPSLADITEDDTANPGQTVASFIGTSIADVDHGAVQGIAITGTTSPHGHWEYSTDNGSSFIAFPSVSTGSALLLAATDWVRFVPDGEDGGTDTFTYVAWDQTTGTHGTTADVSASGGSTAFSAASDTATLTVTAINDAPTATAPTTNYAATEQTSLVVSGTGLHIADVDANSGSEPVTLSVGEGILDVNVGGNAVSVTGNGTSSVTLTGLLDYIEDLLSGNNAAAISYTANSDDPGASTTLTLAIDDNGNSGSGGSHTSTATATIDIAPVNDAPTATAPAANYSATAETDLSLRNTGLSVADVDGGSSIETVTLAVGEGIIAITAGDSGVTNITGNGTGSVTFAGTVAQINALLNTSTGTVVYNDNAAAPSATTTLTLTVQDNGNLTGSASTIIDVTPAAESSSMQLVAESFLGGAGDQSATDVSYANSHLYLTYNAAVTQTASDQSTIVTFETGTTGATQDFSYQWDYGFFNGVAADADTIYAVGASHPTDGGLTQDNSGGQEVKSILVSFNADGAEGSNPAPATGYTPNSFFGYGGVEMFEDILVTTQSGNTLLYAVGFGQPSSYGAYIIAEYNSSGQLVNLAADSMAVPSFSIANDAVEFNGGIWAVGNSWYPNAGDSTNVATVWQANYSLSSVVAHQVDTGSAGANFASAAVIGSALYAVGHVNSNGSDYLIARYNSDGSVAWSTTFGGTGADMLNGVVALDGHLYVVGSTEDGGNTDGVLMEIDTADGSVVSTTTYGGALYDSFNSITTDGNYLYVAGETKSYTNSGNGAGEADAVLVTYAPFSGPKIGTDAFTVTENPDGTTTVSGLYFTDTDATAATDTFNIATDADDPNSVVTPLDESGTFAEINDTLSVTGITYDPDNDLPPDTDMVTLTVTDGFGRTDTVNFIFNEAGMDGLDTTLLATSGKDIIFSTGYDDTLTGGDGADQFVFSLEDNSNSDTIMDFEVGVDRIDIRAFSATVDSANISAWFATHVATSPQDADDTLITLDNNNSVLLKNVTNLQASDFIVSPH